MGGIRVGGGGGGKMARAVIGNPNYYPVDTKAILSDDNIDIALASLKGIEDETSEFLLDIPKTIVEGVKMGGLFLPHEREKTEQKVQVVLMIDNGGYSMMPYVDLTRLLFSKLHDRFEDIDTYYFHNAIYEKVYVDQRRIRSYPIEKLLQRRKDTRIGDFRGPKVVVFKMKRRKGYRRKTGHRQDLSRIRTDNIQA